MRLIASIAVALGIVRGAAAHADSSDVVVASVESLSEADIGRPYTATFEPVTGRQGQSLFPTAKALRKSSVNEWRSDFVSIGSTQMLDANARAWGLVDASHGSLTDQRFMVFRVYSVEYAEEIDDTVDPRPLAPEAGAAYYLRKVYFGRMYEIVISGSKETLNSKVASDLSLLWNAKFGVSAVSSRYRLTTSQKAKGFRPKGEAVFARTVDEIKAAYVNDADMGKPVPILVEYRRIPGTSTPPDQAIDWTPPATAPGIDLVHVRRFSVPASKSDWTDASVTLGEHDVLIGEAAGKVRFSSWQESTDADSPGPGGLDMLVGNSPVKPGKKFSASGVAGPIKLRVRDDKFSDNSGAYDVTLIVIPEGLLRTSDCQKQDTDGSFTACH